MASRFRAVSSSVSPLLTLEVGTLMLMASAERRLAAISKDVRVRVEDSKKRLMTVRPRRAGTFFISRRETSRKVSAVSSRCVISPASSSRMPSRCFLVKTASIVFRVFAGLWSLGFGLWSLGFVLRSWGLRAWQFAPLKPSSKTKDLRFRHPQIKKRPSLAASSKLRRPLPPRAVLQLQRLLPHQIPGASL